MKEQIRRGAMEMGFDDCRFTSAAAPGTAGSLARWLGAGHHGEMLYLARNAEKRIDPQKVLPGAKSLVVLATNYFLAPEGHPPLPTDSGTGPSSNESHPVFARYAQFTDYHEVLAEKLKALTALVGELGGCTTRSLWYVDTGPLLERDLAQRAGIGFVGKHTNLISRNLGNWILLSEILTTLELEPDNPARNLCGKCHRCLEACPTGAITAPFQLDARRCISYLTIELKGSIPVEWRRAIGTRVYGCDDCLAVCPWNRFARESHLMRAHRRPDGERASFRELLALDEAGFKKRFAGTPVMRGKRRGLLRNVCVALGNVGTREDVAPLCRAACDPEPLIAEHAAWALEEITRRES